MSDPVIRLESTVDQELMIWGRIEISDDFGGFFVKMIIFSSIIFDMLHWEAELADIDTSSTGVLS